MRIKFWHKHNKYDSRMRYKVFTIAWGKGLRPLAGSKKYYKHFLTFALCLKWIGIYKGYDEFRAYILGMEIHYRK